jgi:hypothetical protein
MSVDDIQHMAAMANTLEPGMPCFHQRHRRTQQGDTAANL